MSREREPSRPPGQGGRGARRGRKRVHRRTVPSRERRANSMEPSAPGRVLIGTVRRAHGVHGDLSVATFSDQPGHLLKLRSVFVDGKREPLRSVQRGPGASIILGLGSVADRDSADALRGKLVEVESADLPAPEEGEYYHYQVVGAEVCDLEGLVWGTVTEILETGANDVFVVAPTDANERPVLVPAIRGVVVGIDVDRARVTVDLPEGLR